VVGADGIEPPTFAL